MVGKAEQEKVVEVMVTNLKMQRTLRGLSQAQLAKKAGVSKRAIENYEQKVRRIDLATAQVLYRLATALECTMEALMEHDGD
jgi:transcriptional regulator with XRE-family HTH domain